MNSVSLVPLQQDLVVRTVPKSAPKSASTPAPRPVTKNARVEEAFLSHDSEELVPGFSSKGKRFPRTSRLLKHADFDHVYREGKRYFSTNMTVFFLPRMGPPVEGLRIGLTVSRALGGAVDRNRMRRRMREAVRATRPLETPPIDVVINPKRLVLKVGFEVLVKEVDRAFQTVLTKSASSSTAPKRSDGGER